MKKPSPAMVVALLALTGTAIAGSGLITGAQIKDRSVGYVDLAPAAVAKLHGVQGKPGALDLGKLQYVVGAKTDLPANSQTVTNLAASCPAGGKAIAGGYYVGIAEVGFSGPSQDATQWVVVTHDSSNIPVPGAYAIAICANP
jgi:hypothetical protein